MKERKDGCFVFIQHNLFVKRNQKLVLIKLSGECCNDKTISFVSHSDTICYKIHYPGLMMKELSLMLDTYM